MSNARKILVRCTVHVPVEWDPAWGGEDAMRFQIEENSCPGTGMLGAAIESLMEEHEVAGTCWACACNGTNAIVDPVNAAQANVFADWLEENGHPEAATKLRANFPMGGRCGH